MAQMHTGALTVLSFATALLASGCDKVDASAAQRAAETAQRALLERHCGDDTFETVHESIDGVDGLFRIDVDAPGRFFVGGIDGGTSHPHYMFFRLGLKFLEFELDPEERVKRAKRFGQFDLMKSRNYTYVDAPASSVAVKFEHAGSVEEEQKGVIGRRITVFDLKSGKVYGVQQQWFGKLVGGCIDKTKKWTGHYGLLSRTINSQSYRCLSAEVVGSAPSPDARLAAIRSCEENYWRLRRGAGST